MFDSIRFTILLPNIGDGMDFLISQQLLYSFKLQTKHAVTKVPTHAQTC